MTPNTSDDRLRILRQSVDGLSYPSESDEPFDVFCWDDSALASAHDALLAHIDRTRRVEQVPVDQFFAQLNDADDADRYRQLRRTLDSQLADLSVFRVGDGEVRVDIYILGRLPGARAWAGLHTVSVET